MLSRLTRSNLPDPEQVSVLSQSWAAAQPGVDRIAQVYAQYAGYGFGANAVVYACERERIQLLAQAEFRFQNTTTKRLFGTADLAPLERPWVNGTTADLIARMELHAALAGNAYVLRNRDADDSLTVLRPDWVHIAYVEGPHGVGHRVVGYIYYEGGEGQGDPILLDVDDVAHWSPIPDPLHPWRGMSWLTPVLREINADVAMTQHRQTFFDSAGTPNMVLRYSQKLSPETVENVRKRWRARYSGAAAAGATVVLDEGADLTVVGNTFESMRFTDVQSAGEARIAAASGVPAIVAGLQPGLDAATYSNYGQAMKAFGNGTGAYLWRSLCAALTKIVTVPGGARLWWDTTNIPALREDEKDRAANMQTLAAAASTLLQAGYQPDSIIGALTSGDLTLLQHSGLVSVQLYKPGDGPEPADAPDMQDGPDQGGDPAEITDGGPPE